jgi:hypothetical protein
MKLDFSVSNDVLYLSVKRLSPVKNTTIMTSKILNFLKPVYRANMNLQDTVLHAVEAFAHGTKAQRNRLACHHQNLQ